jgi:hypothetical protein
MTDTPKRSVGHPLKFLTVEELQERIDAYFEEMERPRNSGDTVWFEPITITGLALALDTSRQTLCNYEKRDEFFDAITRAKLRCENYAERMLYLGKNAAGPIFALKNFDWKDKQTQEHETGEGFDAFVKALRPE